MTIEMDADLGYAACVELHRIADSQIFYLKFIDTADEESVRVNVAQIDMLIDFLKSCKKMIPDE